MASFEYLCYGSTAITIIVLIFSAGIDFWRIMSVPALEELSSPVKRSDITRWKQVKHPLPHTLFCETQWRPSVRRRLYKNSLPYFIVLASSVKTNEVEVIEYHRSLNTNQDNGCKGLLCLHPFVIYSAGSNFNFQKVQSPPPPPPLPLQSRL